MKRIAAIFITCSLFITHSQISFAKSDESEFDRDYRTLKSIIYTGLTLTVTAGLAAMGWGAADYANDYDPQNPAVANGKAMAYRGASNNDNQLKKGFLWLGRKTADGARRQGMSEETRALHKIPFVKYFYRIGYGYSPVVVAAIDDFEQNTAQSSSSAW